MRPADFLFGQPTHYILKDHQPVPIDPDLWWEWFKNPENRRVKQETVNGYWISTVFVGLNAGAEDPPLLFETEAFDRNGETVFRMKCATWDEALRQHEAAVAVTRAGKPT